MHYLRKLGGTPKGFLGVLPKLPTPQETTEQETDNKQLVAVVDLLSHFGFNSADSQAIAEEALEAGLTAEDVEAWMEYVGRQGNLTNPKGFLRAKLRSGEEPPALSQAYPERGGSIEGPTEEEDRYRYIKGRYAEYIKR